MLSGRQVELIRALSRAKEADDKAEIERIRDLVAAKKRKGNFEYMLLASTSTLLGLTEDAFVARHGYVVGMMVGAGAKASEWPSGEPLDDEPLDPKVRKSVMSLIRATLNLLSEIPPYTPARGRQALNEGLLAQEALSSLARFITQYERLTGRPIPMSFFRRVREAVLVHNGGVLNSDVAATVLSRYALVDADEPQREAIEAWAKRQSPRPSW